MKHSLKFKKSQLRGVFNSLLDIKNISIENNNDVYNSITTILNFLELEDYFKPTNCSYNFFNTQVSFNLELNESKNKDDFFNALKKFETFIEV